jgi:hypothetical protein
VFGEVAVRNGGDGVDAGVRVTVNGVEMTASTEFLGAATVPVAAVGRDRHAHAFPVEVWVTGHPRHSDVEEPTVTVE